MQRIIIVGILAFICLLTTLRAEQTFRSGSPQVALIELFTSEGCSSCPPAEKWLGQLRDHPNLWSEIVPVAWHVNYWDRLGWKDIYASKANTARQYAYAKQWQARSVYTPGFALNGREWRRGDGIGDTPREAGELTVVWQDDMAAQVSYSPPANAKPQHYDVTIALLGGSIISDVRKGENAGRELHHEFVALESTNAKLKRDGSDAHTATLKIAAQTAPRAPRRALAIWITRRGEMTPIQATGGWLE